MRVHRGKRASVQFICGMTLAGVFSCQSIAYAEAETEKERYGYYAQRIEASMDLENTISVQEGDSAADLLETGISQQLSLVGTSYEIDQQLQAEMENGYTWEEPLVVQNPYQISPLTAVVLFQTEKAYGVRITVKGKTEAADLTGELETSTSHRVPIIGLYPDMENHVILELLDGEEVVDSMELVLETEALPEKLQDIIYPVKTSGESAYPLTMVYGQLTTLPFAYDCMGDIRWYMTHQVADSGVFMLSNDRMIIQDTGAYVPSQTKPQCTNLYEMDYLGRAYKMYYVSGGTHHEIIEKVPGGNLLVLTSSMDGHIEDKIQEIDRETGEVVEELILQDILDCEYVNLVDWAHMNTVSYQPETDTIVISPRNLESVIKLNWTTKEIQWILCDPRFWENTEYAQYVLQPEGDFVYHFQQHTAYQIDADLDGNDQTVEVTMFDNHYIKVRKKVLDYFDNPGESYLVAYAVNEDEKTVSQIKKIPTILSGITSSTIYDEDSNHIFGMCGHVSGAEDKRRGMTYEFDYDTEEILNQFSIKTPFYRASEMKIDYNDLESPMELSENYIAGELWQPVEVSEDGWEDAEKELPENELTFALTGQVLYVGTFDHQVSQIIFKGNENTYVYDLSDISLYDKDYLEYYENIPVPLQGLAADDYEIYVMYQDAFYDTQQWFNKAD